MLPLNGTKNSQENFIYWWQLAGNIYEIRKAAMNKIFRQTFLFFLFIFGQAFRKKGKDFGYVKRTCIRRSIEFNSKIKFAEQFSTPHHKCSPQKLHLLNHFSIAWLFQIIRKTRTRKLVFSYAKVKNKTYRRWLEHVHTFAWIFDAQQEILQVIFLLISEEEKLSRKRRKILMNIDVELPHASASEKLLFVLLISQQCWTPRSSFCLTALLILKCFQVNFFVIISSFAHVNSMTINGEVSWWFMDYAKLFSMKYFCSPALRSSQENVKFIFFIKSLGRKQKTLFLFFFFFA